MAGNPQDPTVQPQLSPTLDISAISAKLFKWFFFSVIVAIVPLIFNYFSAVLLRNPVSLAYILYRGELLLISSAIAADAIGDVVTSGKRAQLLKYISAGACILIILSASFLFVFIFRETQSEVLTNTNLVDPAIRTQPKLDAGLITISSIILFIATLISSLSCKALAEI